VQALVVVLANSDWKEERAHLNPDENPSLESSAVGCKGWSGDLHADVGYNGATFSIEVKNALFTADPKDTDPDDRYSAYVMTGSDAATWHVSGPWASGCTASGDMPLQPADGSLDNGVLYGTFVTDRQEGTYSIIVEGYDEDARFHVQCGGPPSEMLWPVIPVAWDGGANEHHELTVEGGHNIADGSFTDPKPVYGGTWGWRLTEVQ
jgi:hypothetical protein